jgi:hypothetical protein
MVVFLTLYCNHPSTVYKYINSCQEILFLKSHFLSTVLSCKNSRKTDDNILNL